jgi:hypothetical protein
MFFSERAFNALSGSPRCFLERVLFGKVVTRPRYLRIS